MARAQSPCKPHSRTVSCTANATATASESKAAKEQQMAHQQGRSGRWRRCLPWRRWLRQRRCRPCRPSVPSPQRRLHAHTPAPCAGLPYMGAVTTGYAQTPTAPLAPKPRHSHTTDGSAQSAHDKPEAAQTQKAYSRQCGLPRQHEGCQHGADTCCASCTSWARGTCHTQPHAAVVRCFCPHCDAHPRNDPKGADVLAWERTANPHSVAKPVASECGWRRRHAPNTASSPAAPWTP